MIKATMKKADLNRLIDDMILDTLQRSGFGRAGGTGLESDSIRRRLAREAGVPVHKISAAKITGRLRALTGAGKVEMIPGNSRTCWKSGAANVFYSDPATYRLAN